MGRGLSPQQREILRVLAKHDEPVPVADLNELYTRFDEESAWSREGYWRDRAFAMRRAVQALIRRGLVVETAPVEVEWSRPTIFGHYAVMQQVLMAVSITPAGRAELE
jgi:hypothetical protein